jgi:hypothetical protein
MANDHHFSWDFLHIQSSPSFLGLPLRSATTNSTTNAVEKITNRMEAIIKGIEDVYGYKIPKRDRDKMSKALSETVELTDFVV